MRRIKNHDGTDSSTLLSADNQHTPAITPVTSSWGCAVGWNLHHSTGCSAVIPDWQIHCSECNAIWFGACWTSHKSSDLYVSRQTCQKKPQKPRIKDLCKELFVLSSLLSSLIFVLLHNEPAYCDLLNCIGGSFTLSKSVQAAFLFFTQRRMMGRSNSWVTMLPGARASRDATVFQPIPKACTKHNLPLSNLTSMA